MHLLNHNDWSGQQQQDVGVVDDVTIASMVGAGAPYITTTTTAEMTGVNQVECTIPITGMSPTYPPLISTTVPITTLSNGVGGLPGYETVKGIPTYSAQGLVANAMNGVSPRVSSGEVLGVIPPAGPVVYPYADYSRMKPFVWGVAAGDMLISGLLLGRFVVKVFGGEWFVSAGTVSQAPEELMWGLFILLLAYAGQFFIGFYLGLGLRQSVDPKDSMAHTSIWLYGSHTLTFLFCLAMYGQLDREFGRVHVIIGVHLVFRVCAYGIVLSFRRLLRQFIAQRDNVMQVMMQMNNPVAPTTNIPTTTIPIA